MAGNKKFDIDLKYGQIQNKVKEMFSKCQIEVKSERDWCRGQGTLPLSMSIEGNQAVFMQRQVTIGFID